VRFDKLLQNLEDLFTWRGQPGGIGGFIQRVYNNVKWTLPRKFEYLLQTLYKCVTAGLSGAMIMLRVDGRENVTE
jgi:hypothetical protein